jgi:hypothetical protein
MSDIGEYSIDMVRDVVSEWCSVWVIMCDNEVVHKVMHEVLNEWVNEWMSEWVNEWVSEWVTAPSPAASPAPRPPRTPWPCSPRLWWSSAWTWTDSRGTWSTGWSYPPRSLPQLGVWSRTLSGGEEYMRVSGEVREWGSEGVRESRLGEESCCWCKDHCFNSLAQRKKS